MGLEELLEKLRNLTRSSTILGRTENFPVIARQHFGDVETLIRQYALDNHDEELGVLKAKVYAYEQIIANSNFAPMIVNSKSSDIVNKAESEDNK